MAEDFCGNGESGSFRVIIETIPCGDNDVTCTKAVTFHLYNYEIHLTKGDGEPVSIFYVLVWILVWFVCAMVLYPFLFREMVCKRFLENQQSGHAPYSEPEAKNERKLKDTQERLIPHVQDIRGDDKDLADDDPSHYKLKRLRDFEIRGVLYEKDFVFRWIESKECV